MRKGLEKIVSVSLCAVLVLSSAGGVTINSKKNVKADSVGSLATEVTGTWSYWDGSGDVVKTNKSLLEKLPTRANSKITRWTTKNYDDSTNPLDMGEWGTSFMWSYTADKWGNSTYAIPMSYKATEQGINLVKPSTVRIETAFLMEQPEDASLTDFVVGPEFKSKDKLVDKVTDWSYDLIFESANSDATMKTTLTQGSPFSYYQMTKSTKMKITRRRKLPSYISYYNGTTMENSTMLVFKVFDNQDDATGYSNYDYYAVYVPEGTTWSQGAGVEGFSEDNIKTLTANFPSEDKAYMSMAWLCESKGAKDDYAKNIALKYRDYAYNFITNTKANFTYDKQTATVKTVYSYELDRKAESQKDGTIMGILPHQYKNMDGYEYLENTARTIRGTMKYIEGKSYETNVKYTGILPSMMDIDDSDKETLRSYVADFIRDYGPTESSVTKEKYDVNTYDCGKKLNRAVQAMEAAEECGDNESARILLNGIKNELADWFTASGEGDDKYFYYDSEIGSLFGFPQAYYTVDGMTDHHFHYGYFINAAAQVALRDKNFIAKYDNIVRELIGDIATNKANSTTSRYPKFRYFSEFEGHSWASGHANFADGNNQESSSEAMNTWAGLILYGQAMQDEELTNTGIYLYSTEATSLNNYWFDVDGDVLDKNFRNGDLHTSASLVWGGKYGYETWWTAEPLQIQGINILPMTAGAFYAASNKDFILKNFNSAIANEKNYTGDDKDPNRWNEIWSIYLAMADPQKAMEYFNPNCPPEAGESKAHAFHTIMAFDKAGVPDLEVTSTEPLSATFVNEAGDRTYVVYNSDDDDKTVKFSDGTEVIAKAHQMTSVADADVAVKVPYKINHYLEQDNGTYEIADTETKNGKVNSTVTAKEKTYEGYTLDETVEGFKKSGVVTEGETLVLNLYYRKLTEDEVSPWSDLDFKLLGTYNGKEISYYIFKNDFDANIKLLDANETFYMEYNGSFTPSNTKGYMNGEETADYVLGGVYKFPTRNLDEDSYTAVKLVSADKKVAVLIKYGDPKTAFRTDDEDFAINTQTETTEQITTKNNVETSESTTGGGGTETSESTTGGGGTETSESITSGTGPETRVSEPATVNDETESTTAGSNSETSNQNASDQNTSEFNSNSNTTSASANQTINPNTNQSVSLKNNEKKASIKIGKTKIRSAKRRGKKIKISLKKITKATGYQLQISKKKSFKKKNVIYKKTFTNKKLVKKAKYIIKKKKILKIKKLWIRARAFCVVSGKTYKGAWSKKKRVK